MATTSTWRALEDFATDGVSYTTAALDIGAVSATRRVIVGLQTKGIASLPTITAVTIGGVTATEIAKVEAPGPFAVGALWGAHVPTGTTAIVDVTLNATCHRLAVDLWTVEGLTSLTPFDTATDTTAPSNILDGVIDCEAGGVIFGLAQNHAATASWTWASLTGRSDHVPEATQARVSVASDDFGSAQTALAISATKAVSATTGPTLLLVSLSPAAWVADVAVVEQNDTLACVATVPATAGIVAIVEQPDTLASEATVPVEGVASTWRASADFDTNDVSYTTAALDVGTASATRYVIVGLQTKGEVSLPTITGVTIGGVAATEIAKVEAAGPVAVGALWGAPVPTGTTVVVDVTLSIVCHRLAVDMWTCEGLSGLVPFDTATDTTAPSNILDGVIDCEAGGVVFGLAQNHAATASWDWIGLTERSDHVPEATQARVSVASSDFGSAQTALAISATKAVSANTGATLLLVSLSPSVPIEAVLVATEGNDTLASDISLDLGVVTSTWRALADFSNDASTYTTAALDIGTAFIERHVVVGLQTRGVTGAPVITNVAIGGVAATEIAKVVGANSWGVSAFWGAHVPTSATAVVDVTLSRTCSRLAVDLWTLDGLAGLTPFDTAEDLSVAAETLDGSIDCEAGGTILGLAQNNASTASWTWTGLTERSDRVHEATAARATAASDDFGTPQTARAISATKAVSANTAPAFLLVSFSPTARFFEATLTKTEGNDTLASAVGLTLAAVAALNELADTLAADVSVQLLATATLTEDSDTFAATIVFALEAAVSLTEIGDTVTSTATHIVEALTAVLAVTEEADSLSATVGGTFSFGLVAYAALVVEELVLASASITEEGDVLSFGAASVLIILVENVTEENDVVVSGASLALEAVGIQTMEAGDTLACELAATLTGTLLIVEVGDVLNAAMTLEDVYYYQGIFTAVETGDRLAAAGLMGIPDLVVKKQLRGNVSGLTRLPARRSVTRLRGGI